jgi:glyoxylase-like metal-dependent hydrolase (beta-lactamase superfamily II)
MMSLIKTISLGIVNVYIVGEKNNVLVDTGTKGSKKKILKAMSDLEIDPKGIELIILTHGHDDHVGGLDELVKITGAKVMVSKLEYDIMANGLDDKIIPYNFMVKILMSIGKSRSKPVESKASRKLNFYGDIFVEDTYDLEPWGISGEVIATPGHSQGSISVLIDGNGAIIGDNLMAFMPWSKPKKPMLGYNLESIKSSMNRLIKLGAKRFYLSHGKDYDIMDIQKALNKF